MTDARIPERYLMDRRIARLGDAAFRSWIVATLWAVANRTDGMIEHDDLPLIPQLDPASVNALTDSGLWTANEDGWRITDYAETQTSRSELEALENVRRREREKKRAQRSRTDANADALSRGQSAGTVPPASRGAAQDRQDRQAPGVSSSSRNGGGGAPPPSTCSRHPNGTDDPCAPCGRARRAREEWDNAQARMPKPPRPHIHKWTVGGTCAGHDGCLERREDGAA